MFHFQQRVLRLKCPANESGESAALVLLIAQALQMFDAVFDRLDMTEHHRRARFQSELVRYLHHFQPTITVDLERRNSLAHAIDQDFTTAARDRAQARLFELPDHFAQRHPKRFREMLEFRWTESVDVNVRIFFPDVLQQIDIPTKRQFGMMPALHQDLHAARGRKLIELLIKLIAREHIMIAIFFRAIKRTELAVNVADVRVVNVSIDNVGHNLASPPAVTFCLCQLASRVRQHAQFLQRPTP